MIYTDYTKYGVKLIKKFITPKVVGYKS